MNEDSKTKPQRPIKESGSAGSVDAAGFWHPRGETLVPVNPKPVRRTWSPFDNLFDRRK